MRYKILYKLKFGFNNFVNSEGKTRFLISGFMTKRYLNEK